MAPPPPRPEHTAPVGVVSQFEIAVGVQNSPAISWAESERIR